MKNLLLVSYLFPPFNNSGTRRVYSWAKYLKQLGYGVFVLTADILSSSAMKGFEVDTSSLQIEKAKYFDLREFFIKRVDGGTGNFLAVNRIKKNIIRAFNRHITGRGCVFGTARMPTISDFWPFFAYKKAVRLIRKNNIDTVITSYPPPVANLLGWLLKKKFKNILWIADFRDLWTQNAIFKGLPLFSPLENFVEKRCVERADIIVVVSAVQKKDLELKYPSKNICVIENGFDEDLFKMDFPWQGKSILKKVGFFGTLYHGRQDPLPLFKAVSLLIKEGILNNVEIDFYGGYSTLSVLEEAYRRYPVYDVIKYKGFVPATEAINRMIGSDALLFIESDRNDEGMLTGKIFEYIYTRKPILCVGVDRDSYLGDFLDKTGLCIICGQDVERIKTFLLELQSDAVKVKPDENYINQFSRKRQVEKLSLIIARHPRAAED